MFRIRLEEGMSIHVEWKRFTFFVGFITYSHLIIAQRGYNNVLGSVALRNKLIDVENAIKVELRSRSKVNSQMFLCSWQTTTAQLPMMR